MQADPKDIKQLSRRRPPDWVPSIVLYM